MSNFEQRPFSVESDGFTIINLFELEEKTREAMTAGQLEVEVDVSGFRDTLERLKHVAYFHSEIIEDTSKVIQNAETDNETLLEVDGLFFEAENFTAPVSQQPIPENEEPSPVADNVASTVEDTIDIARSEIERIFEESSGSISEVKTTVDNLAGQYPLFTDVASDFESAEAATLESYAKGEETVKIPYHFALFTLNYLELFYEAFGRDESSDLTDWLSGKNAETCVIQLVTVHKGLAELRSSEYLCQYYSERGLDVEELDAWLVKGSAMIIKLEHGYYPHSESEINSNTAPDRYVDRDL